MSTCIMQYAPVVNHRVERDDRLLQARRARHDMAFLDDSRRPARENSLPSIHSLNLLTPPNSAEQKAEDAWQTGRSDEGERDFVLHVQDSPAYSQRLFSGSAASSPRSLTSLPRCASQNAYARGDAPARYYAPSDRSNFEKLHIQEPSREDRELAADFFLSLKGVDHPDRASHWAAAPTQTHGLSPRQPLRPVLTPVSTNPQLQATYAPYNHPRMSRDRYRSPSEDRESVISEGEPVSPHSLGKRKMAIPRASTASATSPEYEPDTSQAASKRRRSTPSSNRRNTGDSLSDAASTSRQQAKHVRGKPSKQRRSTNYLDYPDYCPPLSTMIKPIEHAKNVKFATFKDQIDFDKDPLRGEMHEAEAIAATRCHLNGAQYLCTKRQIFEAYVQYLKGERKGNWNKTAAQLVAGIDVQKSSKLWQFFNDVGWFDAKHFSQIAKEGE